MVVPAAAAPPGGAVVAEGWPPAVVESCCCEARRRMTMEVSSVTASKASGESPGGRWFAIEVGCALVVADVRDGNGGRVGKCSNRNAKYFSRSVTRPGMESARLRGAAGTNDGWDDFCEFVAVWCWVLFRVGDLIGAWVPGSLPFRGRASCFGTATACQTPRSKGTSATPGAGERGLVGWWAEGQRQEQPTPPSFLEALEPRPGRSDFLWFFLLLGAGLLLYFFLSRFLFFYIKPWGLKLSLFITCAIVQFALPDTHRTQTSWLPSTRPA